MKVSILSHPSQRIKIVLTAAARASSGLVQQLQGFHGHIQILCPDSGHRGKKNHQLFIAALDQLLKGEEHTIKPLQFLQHTQAGQCLCHRIKPGVLQNNPAHCLINRLHLPLQPHFKGRR